MTVTYSLEVSNTRLGGFAKLLLRWRGSIYRLMYREMIIFTILYYAVAILYRYVLPEAHKRAFEEVARYCREFTDLIPITFVMGFYVAVVVGRWWQQYLAIPWPDRPCLQIATYVQGNDERGRLIRRTLARHLNLLSVLTMQAISTVVRKRFPSVEHLLQAGLMTEEERQELDTIVAPHGNWWIPASWFCQLAMQARKEGRIHDDLHLKSIIDDALTFRGSCGLMWSFDWISVPLVYTQVVTLAVYCFFAACLFGRQYLERTLVDSGASYAVDYYVPIFTFFQFFFYMGWLKVAEQLINPYGEDDDDFELSWIIDRNLQVSYLAVDGLYQKYPKIVKDMFWDKSIAELPYTRAAVNFKTHGPFLGSTMTMNMTPKEKGWHINPIPEEVRALPVKIKTAPETLAKDNDRMDTKPAIATSPFRLHSGTPRRSRFLGGLLKGESRSSLSSRCASKTSLNSLGVSTRQKSPISAIIDPASMSHIEIDQAASGHGENVGDPKSQTPHRQRSFSENANSPVPPFAPSNTAQSAGMHDALPTVAITTDSQLELHDHQNRRVTFDEACVEGNSKVDSVDADLQLLLSRGSASAGTLVSDSGHGGSYGQFDDTEPVGNDPVAINSRTLLLHSNKQ